VRPPAAAPFGFGGAPSRFNVLGYHEDDLMILAHAPGCQLATQEGRKEMHAQSVASTKGV
jgi:hypothetical protein